jgi:hypothetical protein
VLESQVRGGGPLQAHDVPNVHLQVLPKGSMTIATSQTGSTMYMEPKPVMQLNNTASKLADEVWHASQGRLVTMFLRWSSFFLATQQGNFRCSLAAKHVCYTAMH